MDAAARAAHARKAARRRLADTLRTEVLAGVPDVAQVPVQQPRNKVHGDGAQERKLVHVQL